MLINNKRPNTQATFAQLLELFKIGMVHYFEKVEIYNKKRIDALDSANTQAVNEWLFMGSLYQSEVTAAMDEWISKYYKNETLQLAASK